MRIHFFSSLAVYCYASTIIFAHMHTSACVPVYYGTHCAWRHRIRHALRHWTILFAIDIFWTKFGKRFLTEHLELHLQRQVSFPPWYSYQVNFLNALYPLASYSLYAPRSSSKRWRAFKSSPLTSLYEVR